MIKANWCDKDWENTTIKRGQFVTSTQHLSEELGLSFAQIRRCLKKLQDSREIIVNATNRFTLITIVNYSDYQDIANNNDKQNANKSQSNNNQIATTKQEKQEEQEYNIIKDVGELKKMYIANERLFKAFCIGKQITSDYCLAKLDEFVNHLEVSNDINKSFNDFCTHFNFWFKRVQKDKTKTVKRQRMI